MTLGTFDPLASLAPPRPALALPNARALRWLGPTLLTLQFVLLAWWSWGRWTDPVIDFGRELYIAWQVSEGRSLQTDLVSSYGPLSHLLNGLCFHVFGASLLTLVCFNLATLAAAATLLFVIIRSISTQLAAFAGCAVFLAVCAFGHLMFVGNFNFVTPYSHEATQGFTIGLFGLYCFLRFARSPRGIWAAGAGVSVGLVFLTKPEIFVPVAGSLLAGMAAMLAAQRRPGILAIFVLSAILPVAAVFAWFVPQLGMLPASRETLGAWVTLAGGRAASVGFYKNSAGLDNPAASLIWLGKETLFCICLLGPGAVATLLLPDESIYGRILGTLMGVVLAFLAGYLGSTYWTNIPCIMHLGVVALAMVELVQLGRCWKDAARRNARIPRIVVVLFAALMMLKTLLHARFQQFGFVLGVMPAMVLVAAMLDWFPAWLESRGRRGWLFRGSALATIVMLIGTSLAASAERMSPKQLQLGRGSDAFLADERAPIMQEAVDYLTTHLRAQQTLTVFPEGAMVNYLARRRSPVPYVIFTPPEFQMFGNEQMVGAIEAGRPDFVAILQRSTVDFGPARFGIDYATDVRQWLHENYKPVKLFGAYPFTGPNFGILLLERNDLIKAGEETAAAK
jgi:hypothetical protein